MKYKIKRGDNLSTLAKRFGTTVKELAALNGIKNPNLIYAGKELLIPSGVGASTAAAHPGEMEIRNLQLAPIGQPALRPADPRQDAIKPVAPIEELLLGGAAARGVMGVAGKSMELARAKHSADILEQARPAFNSADLMALTKYLKPNDAQRLKQMLSAKKDFARARPGMETSLGTNPSAPLNPAVTRGLNYYGGHSRKFPEVSKLKNTSYTGKERTLNDLFNMAYGGGK
jgi:murein DD-endopeptidase MepM/ murein hydrolase activator NlpD